MNVHWGISGNEHSENHRFADEKSGFISSNQVDIWARIAKQVSEQQIHTKRGILSIIDVILTLGQRGIPIRGNWNIKEGAEDGNLHIL